MSDLLKALLAEQLVEVQHVHDAISALPDRLAPVILRVVEAHDRAVVGLSEFADAQEGRLTESFARERGAFRDWIKAPISHAVDEAIRDASRSLKNAALALEVATQQSRKQAMHSTLIATTTGVLGALITAVIVRVL